MRKKSSKFPVLELLFAMFGLAIVFTVFAEGNHKGGHRATDTAIDPKPTNLKAMSGGHPEGGFAWKIVK